MKTNLLLILILLPASFAFGQDKAFDLSKYKLPDIKRHQMDFSFSANGRNSSSEKIKTDNLISENYDYSGSSIDSRATIDYEYFYNTRKRIFEISSSLVPTFNHYKSTEGPISSLTSNPDLNFNAWGSFSFYKGGNNLFFQVQPYLYHYYYRRESENNNQTVSRTLSNSWTASVGFGAGIGRMEPVADLWQSYYILQKLNAQHSLSRELREDDIYEFAAFASQLKNKRFFDFRERKIAELSALDSLLHKQKLVGETDIAYFTTLNDYWNFANIENRQSGSELKVLFKPDYDFHSTQNLNEVKSKTYTTSISSIISYHNNKPINLNWDRSYWIYSSERVIVDQTDKNMPANFLNIAASIGYTYLPNFRTSISSYLQYNGNELTQYNNSIFSKFWTNSITLRLDLKYYISHQLQVSASVNSSYSDKSSSSTKNVFYTNYNLGINYAIF